MKPDEKLVQGARAAIDPLRRAIAALEHRTGCGDAVTSEIDVEQDRNAIRVLTEMLAFAYDDAGIGEDAIVGEAARDDQGRLLVPGTSTPLSMLQRTIDSVALELPSATQVHRIGATVALRGLRPSLELLRRTCRNEHTRTLEYAEAIPIVEMMVTMAETTERDERKAGTS